MNRPPFRGTLARITIHPVKSLGPVDMKEVRVLPSGALEGDRRFAMFDGDGRLVNGKRDPRVHGVVPELGLAGAGAGWDVDASALDRLRARLSSIFGFPVTIAENVAGGFPDDTDAPGPTLVGAETLEEVARWFPGTTALEMARRFRMNLVIEGTTPFAEDALVGSTPDFGAGVRIRIASVVFEGAKPCARCSVPTRDPETGAADPTFAKHFAVKRRETLPPWAPLERFDHFYRLSVNTRLVGEGGVLRIGDVVETVEE